MQNAWHLETTVQPGGRIEIADGGLPSGTAVDVFILPRALATARRSATEILAEAPGRRLFKTAEEVDRYLREERASWDR